MATNELRNVLEEKVPRLSKRLPDAVVGPANVFYRGWDRLGYFRYLIAAILMWYIPTFLESGQLPVLQGRFGVTVLFDTGYWILLSLGLGVVVGLAGLLDLGYVAFFMLGAYTTALLTDSGNTGQFHVAVWPIWYALPFAVLIAMIAGFALGVPTLRLRGDYLAIVTLGFHEIVRLTANNLTITNGSRGIPGIPHPEIESLSWFPEFGLDPTQYWRYLLIPAILLAVIMVRHLDNSRVGRYWSAIREDEVAAAAMGVPVTKMKVLAFVIGASTSGVAGWIYASKINFVSPNSFPLLLSILVLCSVVIGGLGSVSGAVLGSIIVVVLPKVIQDLSGESLLLGFNVETGRIAVFGVLLVFVMIYRPGGLLAAKRRRTELSEGVGTEGMIHDETAEVIRARESEPQ